MKTALALLFIAAAASGCLQGEGDADAAIVIDGDRMTCHAQDCPRWSVGKESNRLDLRRMDLHGSFQTGVSIVSLSKPLVVTGNLAGVETGIATTSPCMGCLVTLEDLSIDASQTGVSVALPNGTLALRRVSIETAGGGVVMKQGPLTFRFDGTTAIQADVPGIRLEDVAVSAKKASAWGALMLDSSSIEVVGLRVSGYDTAIENLGPGALDLEGLDVQCERAGISSTSSTNVTLESVRIHDCTETAVLVTRAEQLTAHFLELTDNGIGISLSRNFVVRLSSFNLSFNGYGLRLDGESSSRVLGHISDGQVHGNRFVGLETKWNVTEVTNVTFIGNGHGWPDPAGPADPWLYGGLVHLGVTHSDPSRVDPIAIVKGSWFEGNEPYALTNRAYTLVDASGNWWGTPFGTVPYAPEATTLGLGNQAVFGPVVTAPHLTSPP